MVIVSPHVVGIFHLCVAFSVAYNWGLQSYDHRDDSFKYRVTVTYPKSWTK